MQMDQMRQSMEAQKAQQGWRAGLPAAMNATKEQRTPFEADNPFGEDLGQLQNVAQVPDMQARQDYMMAAGSPVAVKLIEQQLFPNAADYKTVGNTLVKIGPDGVTPAFTAPEKQQKLDTIDIPRQDGSWQMFQTNPDGTPNLQAPIGSPFRKRATATEVGGTVVKNINTQESEQSKVYGKGMGDIRVGIQTAAFQAPGKIANLNRMDQLLQGIDSGKFANAGMEAAKFAKSFGIDVDPRLGDKQAAEALAIEMALSMRDPGSGPMTDKDFNNYLNTVPSLAKTAEGRKQITATIKAKAKRDIEIGKMAREYARKNRGVLDDNFLDQVADYMANNPVVPVAQQPGGVKFLGFE